MPRSNRLSLSLASTAAVALASLPLAVSPASAAKVSEGTTSSISVVEAASNAQQFNLENLGVQGSSIVLVAKNGENRGGGRKLVVAVFLQKLLESLGISSSQFADGGFGDVGMQ